MKPGSRSLLRILSMTAKKPRLAYLFTLAETPKVYLPPHGVNKPDSKRSNKVGPKKD